MTILPTDIEDKLNSESFRQFCNNHNINLAVLFGSRVKGMARPNSDYDLAFLMDKNHYSHDRLAAGKLKGALIKDICSFFETSLVDLVLLNKASPFLKFQIARTGKPFSKNIPLVLPNLLL